MQQEIDFSKTKFHGQEFTEVEIAKMTAQLKAIFNVLQDGQVHGCAEICERTGVSYSAYRNRISDLRIYHACDIYAEKVANTEGSWNYTLLGFRTPELQKKYIFELKAKRNAMGNKDLWAKMMQKIYAYANLPDRLNEVELEYATKAWAKSLAGEIGNIKYAQPQ